MTERAAPSGLLREVIDDVVEAVGDELRSSSADPTSTVDVRNGRYVGSAGPDRLWSFEFDGHLPVQPDTPARLHIRGRDPVVASIMAIGDLDLVLGVREELGEEVPAAKLALEPWFIYGKLRDRLTDLSDSPVDVDLADALLDITGHEDVPPPLVDLVEAHGEVGGDQLDAIGHALTGRLRFVWGPPGTGKTATLAATVSELVGRGERVLVVAHSNAAVDVAMVRVAGALSASPALEEARVLRVGTPQLEEARACTAILPDEILRAREPALIERADKLRAERTALSSLLKRAETEREQAELAKRLEAVREELSEIGRRLRELRTELILGAQVIGVTLSKLVIDEAVWSWTPDVVIVDEASMAGLPFLMAIALRGAQRLILYGDFRQLPPIAVSEKPGAKRWFGRDAFELSGVVARREANETDARLSVLRHQYRMGQQIADLVSELAYFGMLQTDEGAARTGVLLAAHRPAPGAQVIVVDTSGMSTACLREADAHSFSRFNALSAAVSATVASGMADDGLASIGIITPYRAQARLLQSMVRGYRVITAATAHKFQGSERDVIVLDLVDALPQEGPSRLTGSDADLSLRLLNVAISRARGMLVLVADLAFIREQFPTTSLVPRLLDLATSGGAPVIGAMDLLRVRGTQALAWRSSFAGAVTLCMAIRDADDQSIDLSLPSELFGGDWLDDLISQGTRDGRRMILRSPIRVAAGYESSAAELRLRTLGVGAVLFLGERWTVIGGRDPHSAACLVTSDAFSSALRRLLSPGE